MKQFNINADGDVNFIVTEKEIPEQFHFVMLINELKFYNDYNKARRLILSAVNFMKSSGCKNISIALTNSRITFTWFNDTTIIFDYHREREILGGRINIDDLVSTLKGR